MASNASMLMAGHLFEAFFWLSCRSLVDDVEVERAYAQT